MKVSEHSTTEEKRRRNWMRTKCVFMVGPGWTYWRSVDLISLIQYCVCMSSQRLQDVIHSCCCCWEILESWSQSSRIYPTCDVLHVMSTELKICFRLIWGEVPDKWCPSILERLQRCSVSAAGWLLLWYKSALKSSYPHYS